MTKIRARGEDIRRFILDHVEKHPANISKMTAKHFNITRQAVNKHLQKLTAERALAEDGHTRGRIYRLSPMIEWKKIYALTPQLAEDIVWRTDISTAIGDISNNAQIS